MPRIKELLRLKHEHGLSVREVARSSGLSVSTVGDYLKRAQTAGLSWPLPEGLAAEQLLEKLFGKGAAQAATNPPAKALPDWRAIPQELRRKGVTLQLLWNEYHQTHAYSRVCELYREWEGTLDPVLHQVQVPGQKMFADWAGQTLPAHNPTSDRWDGEPRASVRGGVGRQQQDVRRGLPNEQLPCWIAGHVQLV